MLLSVPVAACVDRERARERNGNVTSLDEIRKVAIYKYTQDEQRTCEATPLLLSRVGRRVASRWGLRMEVEVGLLKGGVGGCRTA